MTFVLNRMTKFFKKHHKKKSVNFGIKKHLIDYFSWTTFIPLVFKVRLQVRSNNALNVFVKW
jgi:hypothetical protein